MHRDISIQHYKDSRGRQQSMSRQDNAKAYQPSPDSDPVCHLHQGQSPIWTFEAAGHALLQMMALLPVHIEPA